MKNVLLAIIIALCITYVFGQIGENWVSINVDFDQLNPIAIPDSLITGAVVLILIMIGFIVAVSIFGALALAAVLVLGAGLFIGLSAIWPAVLVLLVVGFLIKDRPVQRG